MVISAAFGVTAGLFLFWVKKIVEHPLAVQFQTYMTLPKYGKHLGLIPSLRRDVGTLGRIILGKKKKRRLVVFVDDLDRCKDSSILCTLEAIRLVMDQPNVITVIGIDYRILVQAVETQYKAQSNDVPARVGIARDYLGKIIQLPIRIGKPSQTDLHRFVNEGLFPDATKPPSQPTSVQPAKAALATQTSRSSEEILIPPKEMESSTSDPVSVETPSATPTSQTPVPATTPTDEDLSDEMVDTYDERQCFAALTAEYGFNNPRQLRRLHNSYRLLRLLSALSPVPSEIDQSSPEWLMRVLFWQECLQRYPRDMREGMTWMLLTGQTDYPLGEPTVGIVRNTVNAFTRAFGSTFKDSEAYNYVSAFVESLILPSDVPDAKRTDAVESVPTRS